jgi:glycosyltransferase involved in cell wall biosynthesis
MPEVYQSMDVFVLPSHREGFPRAPMEASAMKVPCVVTDVRGCRQAVAHGRNGLVVPPGNGPALAEAILAVLGDPALARRLGEEGRRRALAEFDERRVFDTVLAEYEQLLEAKGLRSRVPAAVDRAGLDLARAVTG